MKKYITYIILILITTLLIYNHHSKSTKDNSLIMQKNIASKIIRFHVIGNSNSEYDQNLKLSIKNAIIHKLKPILENVYDIDSARKLIHKNLPLINQIAQNELIRQHSSYSAKAPMSTRFFPIKQYGDMTLPEGDYESVCVELGKAKGKNWWCVLYPSLCFIDCTYSVLPYDSKEKLQHSLTSAEYNYIMDDSHTSVIYQSAIYNYIKKAYKKLTKNN